MVIGLAAGFFAGKSSQPKNDNESDEVVGMRTRASGREPTNRSSAPRAPRLKDASEITRLPGGFSRTQSLIDYYGGLAAYQFEDEATKLKNLPGTERLLASFLLFSRWGESDPQTAMEYAKSTGLTGMFARPTVLQS